jgi:hypothetical protein
MAGIPRISMHYQCDFATGASGSLNAQFPLPTSAPAARRNLFCSRNFPASSNAFHS